MYLQPQSATSRKSLGPGPSSSENLKNLCGDLTLTITLTLTLIIAEVFKGFLFSVKPGPRGLQADARRQTQTCLHDADGELQDIRDKNGCFTEKMFSRFLLMIIARRDTGLLFQGLSANIDEVLSKSAVISLTLGFLLSTMIAA